MEYFFLGVDTPQVVLLKGDWGGEERIHTLFEGASWHFRPDGTFSFVRGAFESFREYSIEGLSTPIENGIEFHAESGATSLDGMLVFRGESARLQALYALQAKKVASITQMLSPQPQEPSRSVRTIIGGFLIPSTYRIALSGRVDGMPFDPLPGTLDLLPRSGQDPGAFLVQLMTDSLTDPGHFFWTSFIHFIDGTGSLESTLMLTGDGRLAWRLHPSIVRWVLRGAP